MNIAGCLKFSSSITRRVCRHPSAWAFKRFTAGSAAPETQFSVAEGGKQLRAVWSGGDAAGSSTYHAVWLRHNCQCPRCLSEYKQLLMLAHELDPQVKISEVKLADGDVRIKWSCGHEGYLNLDWLKRHCYSRHTLENRRKRSYPDLGKQAVLPEIDSKELEEDKGVLRWLKLVSEHGMCLVTGVPCTEEAGFEITRKISPHLQETFYGGMSEVKVVENPINISYGPSLVEPHMDVPQYESHPGLVLLHCLRFDDCVEGGESIVVDLLAVMEKLRVTHPHHFDTLVRVPATFNRIHYQRDFPVHMVYRTPHIHVNKHGEIVKMRWCSFNHGPPLIDEGDVLPYYEALACVARLIKDDRQFQVHQRLVEGDVLTVNNHRMLHGRSIIKLNGGGRHLNNFSVNIDEFKSRLQLLCAKYDPDYEVMNVLNHDFSYSGAART